MIIEGIALVSRVESDVAILTFKGVFVLSDQVLLRETIQNYLESGIQSFVFDFQETKSIQSFIIGEILDVLQKVDQEKGGVCLVNLSERMKYTLEITRVPEIIPTYFSLEEALEYFQEKKKSS